MRPTQVVLSGARRGSPEDKMYSQFILSKARGGSLEESSLQGQVLDQPAILTASGQNFTSVVGGIVHMTCEVENLGGNKLNWVFVKHGTTIYHGTQLMVDDSRYSLRQPQDNSNRYSLQILFAKEGDQGVYKCEIDGTKQAVTFHLTLQGAPLVPVVGTVGEPLNKTDCCIERGVSEACLPVCHPSSAPDTLDYASACVTDLSNLLYCGSDGRNHENCCARSGVPVKCLVFCSNDPDKLRLVNSEEDECFNHTDAIISCYEYGGALLPSPPQSLSVISMMRNTSHSLLVSWKPPQFNPSAVSGYIVYYKKFLEDKFQATSKLNTGERHYTLHVDVNTLYTIYVVAVGNHGSSQPSARIDIVTEYTPDAGRPTDIFKCCQARKIPSKCQTTLCQPRVWSQFNTTEMLECYDYLGDVFSCLVGDRDHSDCCTSNNVPDQCVQMCSGHPPAFDISLATCISSLSYIEACVQNGLSTQPQAPQGVNLLEVDAHKVVVTWLKPNGTGSSDVGLFIVQLRRGNEKAAWQTVDLVTGTFTEITNLTETENYAVRIISQTSNSSSLPSAVVRFTTYPEISVDDSPTVAHNFSQCCIDSAMPAVCSAGCQYLPNMTDYFQEHLYECMSYIGTVLTCAADGRNHTSCCERRGVQPECYSLCAHTAPGSLDLSFLVCLSDTAKIVTCYEEGLEDLVRMPEHVQIVNKTTHTISIEWSSPMTGPKPNMYQVDVINFDADKRFQRSTSGLMYILQNLTPGSTYRITVTSVLNGTLSLPSQPITVFTNVRDSERPFFPPPPSNASQALWTNRTHCCKSSGIREECQDVCLDRPAPNGTDCSSDNHNILSCAADGQDHSVCCRANGLAEQCVPLCRSSMASNFSIQLAGCQADDNMAVITSCFLSYSGLVPSMPYSFQVIAEHGRHVRVEWSPASNCDPCSYDVHYWQGLTTHPDHYLIRQNVTSPLLVDGLTRDMQYTFTVTAHNAKGRGPPAPWVSVFFRDLESEVSIVQSPKEKIFDQGTTVYLTCHVINPQGAPRFVWYRRGIQVNLGRVLKLDNVNNETDGNYTCTVTIGEVALSAESFVNVRYKPDFYYFRTDTVSPNIGAEAVLACWFKGHPDIDDPVAVWTKDGRPIKRTSRLSITAKTRYHTGITPFKLKIARVVPSDYGRYQCNVSNKFGYTTAHTKLTDPAKMAPPITPTPLQKQNVSNCCRKKGIFDVCLPLCTFEVSPEEAVEQPQEFSVCLLFFKDLIQCAADGADHTLCCKNKGVMDPCLPYCKGQVPSVENIYDANHLLQCVQDSAHILDCMDTGYGKVPTAPQNLVASFVGSKIKLAWELPKRNADRVTSYKIYYNFTGNPMYQTESITSQAGLRHELVNVDPSHHYFIWMKAESYKVGSSLSSDIIHVSANGTLPMPPSRVRAVYVKGTSVTISWQSPVSGLVMYEGFAVYYKPVNAIKEQKKVTSVNSVTLTGLKAHTEYVAYVKSTSIIGEGRPSSSVTFKTGDPGDNDVSPPVTGKQGGGSDLTDGQVAGVVLAVIAVIATCIVIAIILYRGYTGRKRLAESVSFENPSYDNQQVHISGLPSNNPNDSVMQPHAEPDKEGSFGYARLQEDHVAAEARTKPVQEVDFPRSEYATPADPDAVMVDVAHNAAPLETGDSNLQNNGAAALEIAGADLQNESST